jgi:hypothetical protein
MFWDLQGSTLIGMWQRFGKVKVSCDFACIGKVMLTVIVPSRGDRLLIVTCLATKKSKPRLVSQPVTYVLRRGVVWEVAYHPPPLQALATLGKM